MVSNHISAGQETREFMRKSLNSIGIAALAFLFWITYGAFYGAGRLPARIRRTSALTDGPNGWGSPSMLWLFPALARRYVGMTVVARYPATFNYPARVTAENRPRLEALAIQMIGWLKTEIVCLFAWIQWTIVESARGGRLRMRPVEMPCSFWSFLGRSAGTSWRCGGRREPERAPEPQGGPAAGRMGRSEDPELQSSRSMAATVMA